MKSTPTVARDEADDARREAERLILVERDDRSFRYHDVTLALSKAKAMASVLKQLGEDTNLAHAIGDGSHPDETHDWLHSVVSEALRAALDEAEAAFRKSLSPEEAHRQTIERTGPKAVA